MSSKIVLLFLVVACLTTLSFAQHFQKLPYNPHHHRPTFRNLPYNPINRPPIQTLPYYPKPYTQPLLRARRQAISGVAASNPAGGADVKFNLGHGIGTENHNLVGGVFAAGNTLGKTPVTTGAGLNYNLNGHGLSVLKTHTPGVADTFTQNARVNLLNTGVHNLDANAFKTDTKLANGFNFQKTGANLDYNHLSGHGATLGINNFKNIGTQTEALGRVNLWTSPDRNTKFDLNAGASRWNSGPFAGKNDFKGGFGLTSMFG